MKNNEIKIYAEDILNSNGMQDSKKFIQHGNISVFEHSLSVAIMCLKISEYLKLPIDKRSLIRGALLHDYFLYDWHLPHADNKWHGFRHAKIALKKAENEFVLNDIERNMILCHMFPLNIRFPKYRESIILCIADKICATKETLMRIIPFVKNVKI